MRTTVRNGITAILCLLVSGMAAFAGKTSENLLVAYKGELTASARHAAFADQALKEGYDRIALLFKVISRSEAIHAANHKTVLEKMGVTVHPFTPEYKVSSTKDNLDALISGKLDGFRSSYPSFLVVARQETETSAAKSMRWAMETSAKFGEYYRNALTALSNRTVGSLPGLYWICPKCGNTYNIPVPESICSYCGTASSRFIRITR